MTGEVGILNVGAGDIKVTFDPSNPVESIRAARVVKDMLRRGYALLVEVERNGVKSYERALDFDEKTCSYIIADFDPVAVPTIKTRPQETEEEQPGHEETPSSGQAEPEISAGQEEVSGRGRRGRRSKVAASGTSAVAVGRSAGG